MSRIRTPKRIEQMMIDVNFKEPVDFLESFVSDIASQSAVDLKSDPSYFKTVNQQTDNLKLSNNQNYFLLWYGTEKIVDFNQLGERH